MNEIVYRIQEAGVGGWLQVGLLGLGLLWAVVLAVMLGLRWRVPAVVAVAPLIAHALAAALGAGLASRGLSELAAASRDQIMSLYARSVAGIISNGSLVLVALPAAGLLSLGAVAAGVRAPRRYVAAAGMLLLCGLTAALPLLSLIWHGPMALAVGRAAIFGLAALPVAAAFLGSPPRANTREAGVVAAASWVSLVAASETASLALQWEKVFGALALVSPDSRSALLDAAMSEMEPLQALAVATVLLSALPMLVALVKPDRALSDEELAAGAPVRSGLRGLGLALAALTPLLWLVAMWMCSPADAFDASPLRQVPSDELPPEEAPPLDR